MWPKKMQPKWIAFYSAVKCTSLQRSRHNSRQEKDISLSNRLWGPPALYSMGTGDCLPEIKQREREADNPRPSMSSLRQCNVKPFGAGIIF